MIASFLQEEMVQETIDIQRINELSIRGHPQDRNKNNYFLGRPKFQDRSKSQGKSLRKCQKCGKSRHYKKDCTSKNVDN